MIPSDEAWPDIERQDPGQVHGHDNDIPLDRVARLKKAPTAFRTISEVADDLHVPQHVLRFWETRFPQVRPLKRGGGRRYYRPDDVVLLRRISDLLYIQGYTIKGVQRLLIEGDGGLHGEFPASHPGEGEDVLEPLPDGAAFGTPPTPLPAFAAASTSLIDRELSDPTNAGEFQLLREAFRETLSVILAELEAIRRQLPM